MSKRKMTRRRALELCVELWKWLEKNTRRMMNRHKNIPRSSHYLVKEYWPKYEEYKELYGELACPCCTYTEIKLGFDADVGLSNKDCERYCPTMMLWNLERGCLDDDSVYMAWSDTGKSRYARKIWQFAQKLLDKMDRANKKRRTKRKCRRKQK